MGKVSVENLRVNAFIGTLEYEKHHRQELRLNVEFEYDSARAAAGDDLSASVDYSAVEKRTVEIAENSRRQLLETLAADIAAGILAFKGVRYVKVTIAKPAASAFGALISYSEEFFAQESE